MPTYDGTFQRTLDAKLDGFQGNRLRVFLADGRELPIQRIGLKGTVSPRQAGARLRLLKLSGEFVSLKYDALVMPLDFIPDGSAPFLLWLESGRHAIFGEALMRRPLIDVPEGVLKFRTTGLLHQTPPGLDVPTVLAWERLLLQYAAEPFLVLSGYEHWLLTRAPDWSRLAEVRQKLFPLLAQRN